MLGILLSLSPCYTDSTIHINHEVKLMIFDSKCFLILVNLLLVQIPRF